MVHWQHECSETCRASVNIEKANSYGGRQRKKSSLKKVGQFLLQGNGTYQWCTFAIQTWKVISTEESTSYRPTFLRFMTTLPAETDEHKRIRRIFCGYPKNYSPVKSVALFTASPMTEKKSFCELNGRC